MVSAVLYKDLGISDAQIAFWTSLIMWPWTIKFLWSPFLELYRTKKFWVVGSQLLSGVLFGVAALSLHLPLFFSVSVAVFAVVAFSGATHDIAADGVYMSELSPASQAKYIGWQGAFYNLAKLVATGGLVWLAGWLYEGFSTSADASSLRRLCPFVDGRFAAPVRHARRFGPLPSPRASFRRLGFRRPLAAGWPFGPERGYRGVLHQTAYLVLYRLHHPVPVGRGLRDEDRSAVPQSGYRIRAALGLTNQQIGLYYGTFGAGAFLIGSLLAGYYIARRGLRRTLFTLCCIFNLPFGVYALLAWFQPSSMWLVGGGIVVEYFGYGFGFVGLTLFMMQQVAPGRHQMAHYAFASGIMNLSVMLTGMASGFLSDLMSYRIFFLAVMLATIPAFVITRLVPFTYDDKPNDK